MSAAGEKAAPSAGKPAAGPSRQAERRLQILDAALRVFGRDGFGAARTDDIAREAGAAKGTLYTYFSSKEEMFEEAVRARLVPLIEETERMQQEYAGPAADLLRLQITFLYDQLIRSDLREIMRMMIAEGPRFPRLARFYHDTVLARGRAALKRTIRYGVERGEFRPDLCDGAERVVMGPAVLATVWTLLFETIAPLDIDKHMQAHLHIIMNGLKNPAPGSASPDTPPDAAPAR